MAGVFRVFLAPPGTTGNNTHSSVRAGPLAAKMAVVFVVEAVGATPTVTWKAQGSLDHDDVSDANSAWFDLPYITPASDTLSQATRAMTATGSDVVWLALSNVRMVRKVRLVTTSNTNVTYRAALVQQLKR